MNGHYDSSFSSRPGGKRHFKTVIFLVALIIIVASVSTVIFLNASGKKGNPIPVSQPAGKTGSAESSRNDGVAKNSLSTAVTSNKINIRSGVGTENELICTIPVNTRLELTGKSSSDGTWVQVKTSNGRTGWCGRAFLDVDQIDDAAAQALANVEKPLSIRVSLANQKVFVLDSKGTTIKTFLCSSGIGSTTPKGTFTVGGRGKSFYNSTDQEGGYYWTRFYGDYLFHSIPFDEHYEIEPAEAAKLGTVASHGCIRLAFNDAKWIYYHISDGTKVVIK